MLSVPSITLPVPSITLPLPIVLKTFNLKEVADAFPPVAVFCKKFDVEEAQCRLKCATNTLIDLLQIRSTLLEGQEQCSREECQLELVAASHRRVYSKIKFSTSQTSMPMDGLRVTKAALKDVRADIEQDMEKYHRGSRQLRLVEAKIKQAKRALLRAESRLSLAESGMHRA